MGGAGDSPAPVGDPLTGMAKRHLAKRALPLVRPVVSRPSGGSPDGTGGSPVPPKNDFSGTLLIAILILPPIRIKSRIKIMIGKAKGRTFVRPLLMTRFIRLHPGAQKGDATNLGALSEPRREQNLYANPKRTAKSSLVCQIRPEPFQIVQKMLKLFRPVQPCSIPRFQRPSSHALN